MGHSRFLDFLFQVRLYAFAICETLLFIALTIALTIHSVSSIVHFFSGGTP
jgi:hypothetical protein